MSNAANARVVAHLIQPQNEEQSLFFLVCWCLSIDYIIYKKLTLNLLAIFKVSFIFERSAGLAKESAFVFFSFFSQPYMSFSIFEGNHVRPSL